MIELRPYQRAAIELVRDQYRAPLSKRRPILVLPTAGGKTLTATAILIATVERGKRVMFVCHRKELIDQTVRAFSRLGVAHVGVIRANDKRTDPSAPIQIASVDTLHNRPPVDGLNLIVIDECHLSLADRFLKHVFMAYPKARFLGLTATPLGPGGKPMGAVFDSLVIGTTYATLIRDGHVVEPIVFSTPTQADLSQCRTSGGDYNADDLEKAVNNGTLIGNLVAEWRSHASDRQTVVFAVSVAHSQAIVEKFLSAGVAAEHLDGTTPEGERGSILSRLAEGRTRVVSNVGVLTTGWDSPPVKCGIIARPTKSLTLWRQMAGRFFRPWRDITPILLDHGGNFDRHGHPTVDIEWSLTTKPKRTSEIAPMRLCKNCYAYYSTGCKACPHCEAISAPTRAEKKEQEAIDVALAQRSREQIVRETKLPAWAESIDDTKAGKTFKALLRKRIALGYKAGYVRHAFEAVMRFPLPREWGERL